MYAPRVKEVQKEIKSIIEKKKLKNSDIEKLEEWFDREYMLLIKARRSIHYFSENDTVH